MPGNRPILIVCYTNHALDQFLKHILIFTNKTDVLRMGGRCRDEELQECLFKRVKSKIFFNWSIFKEL